MTVTAGELAQIVWAETRSLGIGRGDGTGEVNVVRRSIAQLAASKGGAGFEHREPLPSLNDRRLGDTVRAIMTIADSAKDAAAPQRRLIIWDAGPDSSKLDVASDPAPPKPWASLSGDSIVNLLRYELPNGRTVDVFSRAPLADDADGAPLVNALTGTGLADGKPRVLVAPAPAARSPDTRITWLIGIVGVILFVAGGAMSALSGLSMSGARNSLAATDPAYQRLLLVNIATVCVNDNLTFPEAPRIDVCKSLVGDSKALDPQKLSESLSANAASVLTTAGKCTQDPSGDACRIVWPAAVKTDQDQVWKKYFFGWMYSASAYLSGLSSDAGSTSIVVPFLITLVGATGLLVALGLSTKGRIAGIWIDTRNRVSLARAQVTLWTIVVLAGYLVLALFNIGFAGILQSPDALVTYHAFPSIPASIAAALGIAASSTMLSALILPTKDQEPGLDVVGGAETPATRGAPFFGNASSGLDKRPDPALASIVDIFMGEENANADTVDVARLQNVMITITLVFGFFCLLVEWMSNIRMSTMLSAHDAIFRSLPDLGVTFTSLLGVSHATYLVAKAHNSQNKGVDGTPAGPGQ